MGRCFKISRRSTWASACILTAIFCLWPGGGSGSTQVCGRQREHSAGRAGRRGPRTSQDSMGPGLRIPNGARAPPRSVQCRWSIWLQMALLQPVFAVGGRGDVEPGAVVLVSRPRPHCCPKCRPTCLGAKVSGLAALRVGEGASLGVRARAGLRASTRSSASTPPPAVLLAGGACLPEGGGPQYWSRGRVPGCLSS